MSMESYWLACTTCSQNDKNVCRVISDITVYGYVDISFSRWEFVRYAMFATINVHSHTYAPTFIHKHTIWNVHWDTLRLSNASLTIRRKRLFWITSLLSCSGTFNYRSPTGYPFIVCLRRKKHTQPCWDFTRKLITFHAVKWRISPDANVILKNQVKFVTTLIKRCP